MEPAHEERDDPLESLVPPGSINAPQWSPLTKSGMTTKQVGENVTITVPQWSPLTKSGMTRAVVRGCRKGESPQWSPLTKSGMTVSRKYAASPSYVCRNGARSRRAG